MPFPGRLPIIALLIAVFGVPLSGRGQEAPTSAEAGAEPVAATPADPGAAESPSGGTEAPPAAGEAELGRASLLELFRQANPLLWPLVLCSIVTLGYSLERLIALRRRRVIPRDFVDRFLDRLSTGKLDRDRAIELCRANESPIARVFGRIVQHWGQPAGAIREAIASEAAGEVLDLKRNVRVLNGTATLAPLLGLLGTVFGMIEAFDALGNRTAAGVGKSEALAHGISLALMATAFGLAIAVVAVTMYYYLLNRVDVLVRAMDQEATRVIDLVAGDPTTQPAADYRRAGVGLGDLARHDLRGM